MAAASVGFRKLQPFDFIPKFLVGRRLNLFNWVLPDRNQSSRAQRMIFKELESRFDVQVNDCKYGFETQGNVQRLSLLRSPKGPDEHADMGTQTFKYAIAPHRGNFVEAAITRAGLNFNNEMRIAAVAGLTSLDEKLSAIKIDGPPNVFLETVKRAEDDVGLDGHYKVEPRPGKSILLRTYEGLGGSAVATIKT